MELPSPLLYIDFSSLFNNTSTKKNYTKECVLSYWLNDMGRDGKWLKTKVLH